MRFSLALIAGVLVAIAISRSSAAEAPPARLAKLRTQIEDLLRATRTPGAAVALVRRDSAVWVGGLGFADVARQLPATEHTLFRLGSTTKIFVGLAALKLEAEGKLSLQDTLRSRAPELSARNAWEATDPVRIVHLLEHTSGWSDMTVSTYAERPEPEGPLATHFPLWANAREARWRPGTLYCYSNSGISAAAYVVEKVTGEAFEDYVRRSFFAPLRMNTATFFDPSDGPTPATRFYRRDGVTTLPYWRVIMRPAGSLNASAAEMTNVVRLFLGRGEFEGSQLLPSSVFDRMEQATTTFGARESLNAGYGITLYAIPSNGWTYHGHDGGVIGGFCEFAYLREAGLGYVFISNAANRGVFARVRRLLHAYIEEGLPRPTFPAAASVAAGASATYDGWYESMTPRAEQMRFLERFTSLTKFTLHENALTAAPLLGPRSQFPATSARTFRTAADSKSTIALISDAAEGNLIQVTGVDGRTFRRVGAWRIWVPVIILVLLVMVGVVRVLYACLLLLRGGSATARTAGSATVRRWPTIASLVGLALVATYILAAKDGLEMILRLGRVTPWSVALFSLSLLFPLCAVIALVQSIRFRRAEPNPFIWWPAFTSSLLLVIVASYLGYSGVVGIRTWQ